MASRLSGQGEDGLCGPMSWETLYGRVLKEYPSDGEDEQRLAEVAGAWAGVMNEVNAARGEWMGGTDAILAYSFGGM